MRRSIRMFEIIQILRRADVPLTAAAIAAELEVTKRTVYRDVAALQAMRVPIEGAAGIGYVMRQGYDLPPLMFTADEVEAVVVGLALLGRTGDVGLARAAASAGGKIAAVLPAGGEAGPGQSPLYASTWNAVPAARVDLSLLRRAIRDEEMLRIGYIDGDDRHSARTIKPLAIIYYIDSVVLTAWCGLRRDFRHFRVDRIDDCAATARHFRGQGDRLRADWRRQHRLP